MPRTIHVTVTYSVHVDDDALSDSQAKTEALNIDPRKANVFESNAKIFERWKHPQAKRGLGSY
jgi:hypothetical protein